MRSKAILEGFGLEVAGYLSPSLEFRVHTVELPAAHEQRYSPKFMDDIRPCRHEHSGLMELPEHWVLDDAPLVWFDSANWMKRVSTTAEVRTPWQEESSACVVGGSCWFTSHPQIIGRPSRPAFLDAFVGFVADHDYVRISTCVNIASRVS